MAYVRVDKKGNELIANGCDGVPIEKWLVAENKFVTFLRKGDIKKLLGKTLTFEDGPVELKNLKDFKNTYCLRTNKNIARLSDLGFTARELNNRFCPSMFISDDKPIYICIEEDMEMKFSCFIQNRKEVCFRDGILDFK